MFNSARLKLTAWYLLIIMLVSLSFSLAIYEYQAGELDRFARVQELRLERTLNLNSTPQLLPIQLRTQQSIFYDLELLEETKRRLLFTLLAINGGILVLSGALGYFLAGKTLKPIQSMLDEQNQFISDASHELRTPLTALKSSIEVHLRDKNLTLGDTRELLKSSLEEVNKMQMLSEGLLQLSVVQKNYNQRTAEQVNLWEAAEEAVKKISPLSRTKKIRLQLTGQKSVFVYADKNKITQLLVVFLDNAVKYSNKNSEVNISVFRENKSATVKVSDSGIGIPPQDLPHIFDRFYRADQARTKTGSGGYGLGLAIAKKITDEYHGTVSASSKPGEGTVITLHLPEYRKKNASF